jgi:uncharacterized protein YpmB
MWNYLLRIIQLKLENGISTDCIFRTQKNAEKIKKINLSPLKNKFCVKTNYFLIEFA